MQASAAQTGQGIDLVYGWQEEGGVVSVSLPSAAAATELWEAAGVDLLDLNAAFWKEQTQEEEKSG